ncbi:hypothetical protein [Virgibacillus sediminis]|uniref:Uncharacterized protein n=1 Tax=Virgibacillus sediminis TaxID=202260 RepID=A0ABV7A673_9BACI
MATEINLPTKATQDDTNTKVTDIQGDTGRIEADTQEIQNRAARIETDTQDIQTKAGNIYSDTQYIRSQFPVQAGVDWSNKKPMLASSGNSSESWTTVVSATGSGYVLGIAQHVQAISDSTYGQFELIIDGYSVEGINYLSYAGDTDDGISGAGISTIFRFNSSFEIVHRGYLGGGTVRTVVSYVLD